MASGLPELPEKSPGWGLNTRGLETGPSSFLLKFLFWKKREGGRDAHRRRARELGDHEVAFAGAQASVQFISNPTRKNRGRAGRSGLPGPGTCPCLSLQCALLLSLGKGKLRAPGRSGAPRSLLAMASAPGGVTYCGPPYPGSKYGSRTTSVRLQASPSAEPEKALAASDYTRSPRVDGGGGGSSDLAPTPPRPADEQGVFGPAGPPGPRGCGKVPPGPGAREPRALAPRAGYLPSLRSYRGGARRAPGWR